MTPSTRRVSWLSLVAFVGLTCGGCTTRVADLTVVSTKNIDLSNVSIDVKQGQRIKGEDCAIWPLGIPIRIPTIETAVDRALEKGGGNFMIDQVTYQSAYTMIIASYTCIRTEGTVLNAYPAK